MYDSSCHQSAYSGFQGLTGRYHRKSRHRNPIFGRPASTIKEEGEMIKKVTTEHDCGLSKDERSNKQHSWPTNIMILRLRGAPREFGALIWFAFLSARDFDLPWMLTVNSAHSAISWRIPYVIDVDMLQSLLSVKATPANLLLTWYSRVFYKPEPSTTSCPNSGRYPVYNVQKLCFVLNQVVKMLP